MSLFMYLLLGVVIPFVRFCFVSSLVCLLVYVVQSLFSSLGVSVVSLCIYVCRGAFRPLVFVCVYLFRPCVSYGLFRGDFLYVCMCLFRSFVISLFRYFEIGCSIVILFAMSFSM